MDSIIRLQKVIKSEWEYFLFVRGMVQIGVVHHNPYDRTFTGTHGILDGWDCLSEEQVYDGLGIASRGFYSNEGGLTVNFSTFNKEDHNLTYSFHREDRPQPHDYPILIDWAWGEDLDRIGKITANNFDWVSLNEITYAPNSMTDAKAEWTSLFGEKHKELERIMAEDAAGRYDSCNW